MGSDCSRALSEWWLGRFRGEVDAASSANDEVKVAEAQGYDEGSGVRRRTNVLRAV